MAMSVPVRVVDPDEEKKHRHLLARLTALGVVGGGAGALVYHSPAIQGLGSGIAKGIAANIKRKTLARIHPRLVELAQKIDLGDRYEGDSCAPVCSSPNKRINYPTLYVSGKKSPIDIPDKGKATIEYHIRNRSMNKRGDDDESHSVDIEVHSIEPEDTKDKQPKEGEAAKLLHDLRKRTGFAKENRNAGTAKTKRIFPAFVGSSEILFDDSRKRNSMGEFVGNETEGIDPNSMAAAYGPPAVQPVNPMAESHIERIKRFFGKRRESSAGSAAQ
jgi:hypothetical protein